MIHSLYELHTIVAIKSKSEIRHNRCSFNVVGEMVDTSLLNVKV